MGEFFDTPKKQEVSEDKRRYSTDPNELLMWFNVEIDRCNEVNRQAANTILPDVVFLKGDSKREGKIKIITDRMENEYRMLRNTSIGPDIEHLLVVVERLVMNENNYTQLLSKSVGNLIFMVKNSMEIIKAQKEKIVDLQKEKREAVKEIRQEMQEEVQQFKRIEPIVAQTETPNFQAPPMVLTDYRKLELDEVFRDFQEKNKGNKYDHLAFARLVNPTATNTDLNDLDRQYLKELFKANEATRPTTSL